MASMTVKVPQGFPVGTTLNAYVDRVGDIIPQGTPAATAVVASDSTLTLTGLAEGIPYQVGAVIGGVWRAFLIEIPVSVPNNLPEVIAELEAHEADTTNVHGIADTAAVGPLAPTTAVYTTASLAAGARESGAIAMAKGYRIRRVVTNRPARVRLYSDTTKRDADAARPITTDPLDYPSTGATPDHGCMFEAATSTGHLDLPVAPNVSGAELSGSANVGLTVDNLDTATGAVTVTLYYQKIEP